MRAEVSRVVVSVDGVPAVAAVAAVHPHVRSEVLMGVANSGVEHRDDHVGGIRRKIPCRRSTDGIESPKCAIRERGFVWVVETQEGAVGEEDWYWREVKNLAGVVRLGKFHEAAPLIFGHEAFHRFAGRN